MKLHDPNPKPVQTLAFWSRRAYLAVALGLTAIEFAAIVNKEPGDTISEVTRDLFAADTRRGAIVWYCFWVPFATWFGPHIAKIVQQKAGA